MKAEHDARVALDLFLVVGVHQEREGGAVGTGGGFDDVRHVPLAGSRVEVLEFRAGVCRVLGEIEVPAIGDALKLGPADGEEVLDIARSR